VESTTASTTPTAKEGLSKMDGWLWHLKAQQNMTERELADWSEEGM
jgi:hypothetical protein